jgi:hypothetical protein
MRPKKLTEAQVKANLKKSQKKYLKSEKGQALRKKIDSNRVKTTVNIDGISKETKKQFAEAKKKANLTADKFILSLLSK